MGFHDTFFFLKGVIRDIVCEMWVHDDDDDDDDDDERSRMMKWVQNVEVGHAVAPWQ